MPTRPQVIEDLAAFSDLGTAPAVLEDVASHLLVEWTYQGMRRRLQVNGGANDVVSVRLDDRDEMSYSDFLASPDMGDLGRLATKIKLLRGVVRRRSARELASGEKVFPMDWYVDPRLTGSAGGSASEGSALERLHEYADGSSEHATRLLFVMAEAGQGKSSVLEEFTVQQAERYLRRESVHLALYIDAQGRGLARLDEVISRQLIELQFLLGYNALVTLVREGLVVLVIDGFDELIGSRGTFDDAFRSLTAFLEILEGQGSLIAAGRSTYFIQEYEARGRLLSESLRYTLEQVFLKPWTQSDQDRFVELALSKSRLGEQERERARAAFREFQEEEQLAGLLSRPLFARDVLFILLDGGSKPSDLTADRLIPYLAHEYLLREVEEKLRTADGSFLDPAQLEEYYQQLAEQMWELETREIDVSDAEFIMDTWAEDSWHLSGQAREIARARAGKLPFLSSGDSARRVRFEHEVFFGYFLASSLVPALSRSQSALSLLSRGRLDPLTSDIVVQISALPSQSVLDALAQLGSARHPRWVQIEVNLGALAAAVMRGSSSTETKDGLLVRGVTMSGEVLSRVKLQGCRFESVTLDRVDLRGSQLLQSSATGLRLDAVLVDAATTKLEIAGIEPATDVNGLQFEAQDGLLELTYDPATITRILQEVGLVVTEKRPRFEPAQDVLDRIERICRAYRHANPIGTNHDRFGSLLVDDVGQPIRDVLLSNGLLAIDAPKQTKGGAQTFYRKRFDEAEFMGALRAPAKDPAIETAWKELAKL